jgi:hypothetical protein
MLIRVRHALIVSAVLFFSAHVVAQTCPTGSYPNIRFSGTNCNAGGSPCALNSPVTFTLVDYAGAPYSLQSCETGVVWQIEGTTQNGLTVQHSFSAVGQYFVTATIQSTPYSRQTYTYLLVANGFLTMSAAKTSVVENEGTAVVNVHTTYSPTTVSYVAYDYSAAAGRFTPVSGTLSFAAGESDKSVSIPLIDDSLFTGTGQIGFRLSDPTNGVMFRDSYGSFTMGPSYLQINLLDNDPPPTLNWSLPKYTFSENAGNAVLTVNRTGDMTRIVNVNYTVYGSNYLSGNLTFAANETAKTITVPIPNDSVWMPDRAWSATLYAPYGGGVLAGPPNTYNLTVPITITDDEPVPTLSISDVSIPEGNGGRSPATVTLSLSAAMPFYFSGSLSFGGTASRTVDYDNPQTTGFFFNPGETTKTVTVNVIGDTQVEPNEAITLTISNLTNYQYPIANNAPVIAKATGTITILNDDVGMAWLKVPIGTTGRMSIYLGNPTTATDTVTLTSSRTDIAKVPASFIAQSGRSTLDFDVQGVSVGTSLITAKLPASLGGTTLTANADVYTTSNLTTAPNPLSIPVNTNGSLTVTMSPAPPAPVDLKVATSTTSIIQLPATVTIGTSGVGTLNVKGLAVGNGFLTITLPNENGGFDTSVNVTVTTAPTGLLVTQVAPPNGPTAGGTATTISGLNFASPCAVTFGSNAAMDLSFVSATTLKATTPAHAAGTVDVGVTCGSDHYTFANGFTYVSNAPHLASVSPVSGNIRGGTVVVVSGSDLRSSCGVMFGGVAAKIVSDLTPDKLVVTTPAHDAGAVDVTLQCGDSSAALNSAFAFVTNDEPSAVIGDVDPLAASPGQGVTINGIRFRPTDVITFGTARAAVTSTLPTSHVAIVPGVAAGKVAVTLTDSDGHSSTTGPIFTVLEPITPEITSVSPARVAPGGEIVITGKGFRPPYVFALDDKSAGAIVDLSVNRAVVRIDPSRAIGSYTLGVLNAGGNLAAIGPKVDVVAALMASAIAPICSNANGGGDATITGGGFQQGATVMVGTAAATNVRVVDDHTIKVTVPEGHIGWPTVTIKNPNGDSATLTRAFFYYSPYDKEGGCASTRIRGVRH